MIKIEDIVMGRHDYLFIEHKRRDITHLHHVRQPGVSEDGFYQQGVSAGAFRQREVKRFAASYTKGKIPARWFSAEWGTQVISSALEQEERMRTAFKGKSWDHEWREADLFVHKTVYDFYKCIGYDYKTKKWL